MASKENENNDIRDNLFGDSITINSVLHRKRYIRMSTRTTACYNNIRSITISFVFRIERIATLKGPLLQHIPTNSINEKQWGDHRHLYIKYSVIGFGFCWKWKIKEPKTDWKRLISLRIYITSWRFLDSMDGLSIL